MCCGAPLSQWVDDRANARYGGALESAGSGASVWDEMQQQRRPLAFSCRGSRRRVDSVVGAEEDEDEYDDSDEEEDDDVYDDDDEAVAELSPTSPPGRKARRSGAAGRIRRRSVDVFLSKGASRVDAAAGGGNGGVGDSDEDKSILDGGGDDIPFELPSKDRMVRVQDGKGWKAMLFVVKDGMLCMYPDENRTETLAAIPCALCLCSDPKSKRDDAPGAFRIDVDYGKSSSHAGWMTKQGEHRKSWKRRWFQIQLQGTELAYYDKQGGKSKGSIELTKCQTVRTHDQDVLIVQLMAMTDEGKYREYLFRCDNEDDCMMWINAISQCLAKNLANIEQDASGGLTVGAGFQKKYIVDPGCEDEKQDWFDVLGGKQIRKMDGLHRLGVAAAKKAKAGASNVAAQAQSTREDILGEDTGADLNLELLTAGEKTVLQVCVDNDVKSCAGISSPGNELDPDSGDPFMDLANTSFEQLRVAVLLSNPAFFCIPVTASSLEVEAKCHILDYPATGRECEEVELPVDVALLRWCEELEYKRRDGGHAYAAAVAAWRAKGCAKQEWLAHVMLNDWPSSSAPGSGAVAFVEAERAQKPRLAQLPFSIQTNLSYSLHRVAVEGGEQLLLVARGATKAVLRMCSDILLQGEPQTLTEILVRDEPPATEAYLGRLPRMRHILLARVQCEPVNRFMHACGRLTMQSCRPTLCVTW
eukprot:SAG11_NODE_1631_length_4544_cov_3.740832_1_plen_700_part_00